MSKFPANDCIFQVGPDEWLPWAALTLALLALAIDYCRDPFERKKLQELQRRYRVELAQGRPLGRVVAPEDAPPWPGRPRTGPRARLPGAGRPR